MSSPSGAAAPPPSSGINWNLIVAILGVIATLASGLFFVVDRNINARNLVIRTKVSSPVITKETTPEGLTIQVSGKDVEDVYITEMFVGNIGGDSIGEDDFIDNKPIGIIFDKSCSIVQYKLNEAQPKAFSDYVKIRLEGNSIIIPPTVFNRGDSFNIRVITSNCIPKYQISGRLVGISDLSKNIDPPPPPLAAVVIGLVLILGGFTFIPDLLMFFSLSSRAAKILGALLSVGAGIILGIDASGREYIRTSPAICQSYGADF